MKIVLIHGQNHKGSSYHIGRILAEQFENSEVQEFFLPRDLEHFCIGCYNCIETEEKCPFYTEKKRIMREVERADLLIFTTPTYCMRASAPMKSFIDLTFTYWMSHKPRACMFSKRAVVISTAAGTGAKSAVKDVATALFYWGVPYIKEYGIAVQAMNWAQVTDKKKEKINADMVSLAKKISKQTPHVGIKTKFMFHIMRMMQQNNMGSGETEKTYWQEQGWLDKARPWS
ncbi:MAG: NAD(P)H-dependent oxidoreductase [Lachnospiraceae bacterium]|nr:NAD(P)H-dependent oxidoreductase [Lachnospiraceae bacterium]